MHNGTSVRLVFLVLILAVIGEAYNTRRGHSIQKRSPVCTDENGYLWFENECYCVDLEHKCCCGSGEIHCIDSRSCDWDGTTETFKLDWTVKLAFESNKQVSKEIYLLSYYLLVLDDF